MYSLTVDSILNMNGHLHNCFIVSKEEECVSLSDHDKISNRKIHSSMYDVTFILKDLVKITHCMELYACMCAYTP